MYWGEVKKLNLETLAKLVNDHAHGSKLYVVVVEEGKGRQSTAPALAVPVYICRLVCLVVWCRVAPMTDATLITIIISVVGSGRFSMCPHADTSCVHVVIVLLLSRQLCCYRNAPVPPGVTYFGSVCWDTTTFLCFSIALRSMHYSHWFAGYIYYSFLSYWLFVHVSCIVWASQPWRGRGVMLVWGLASYMCPALSDLCQSTAVTANISNSDC